MSGQGTRVRLLTSGSAPGAKLGVVRILDEQLEAYLHESRPERSAVMAELEAVAERDSVPIVHWETGRFLATLCRALDPVVLEVGTAIGYSGLHMAEQLREGRLVTLELDPERARQAHDAFERAGVTERVELVEGDARETIPALAGPFDLLFVDAAKVEYRSYIELAESKLSPRALLIVDNLLMGGGRRPGRRGHALESRLARSRAALNAELLSGAVARLGAADRRRHRLRHSPRVVARHAHRLSFSRIHGLAPATSR